MTDVTTNALRGLVKTLGDVVVPSIPSDDPLALQELKMVIRYLNFLRERVDHLHARARYELAFHADLAGTCIAKIEAVDKDLAHNLAELWRLATALLNRPDAIVRELQQLTQEIATEISALLGRIENADCLRQIERTVVEASAEITAFDRAWYAPMKLERFPDELRPLGTFISI